MLYSVKFGKKLVFLRLDIMADYWVCEGLFFADEYYPVRSRKDDVVLDVGANIGIFTLKVAKNVKRVISVKPEPQNFSILSKNIAANYLSNVTLLNLAVSDKEEVVHFQGTGGTAEVSTEGTAVDAQPLDMILDKLGNPKITILKMDIEGYEGRVLSVFNKLDTIKQIVIETHSIKLTDEVTQILVKHGFSVFDISRIKRLKVIKNILLHPFSFLSIERINKFITLKQVFRGESSVAANNPDSELKLLWAIRKN